MVSLMLSSSWDSLSSSRFITPPPQSPSGSSVGGSLHSSSSLSLDHLDEENDTVTANAQWKGKQRSQEDLRLLTISSSITELSYTISDIQTRIFEIQELRHQSEATADASGASNIDQSLSSLDERLEAVAQGLKSLNESMAPYIQAHKSVGLDEDEFNPSEETLLVRKHEVLLADWDAIQKESDMLREELREDKWLTVFRTVTEQADGMMASLEKAVNRCQEFVLRFNHGTESLSRSSSSSSMKSDNSAMNIDVFTSLSDAYEAKKKHYMPATSKVLSILDKGVQDRVTKNGECLRRHAESTQRWQGLQQRIVDMDSEMERVRRIILGGDTPGSDGGSSASRKNGYLATPESRGRSGTTPNSIKRSISPFRKLARKLKGTPLGLDPSTPSGGKPATHTPSSEPGPSLRRQKTNLFSFKGSQPTSPVTPERLGHRQTQSAVAELSASTMRRSEANTLSSSTMRNAPPWNSSTKVEPDERERLTVSTTKLTGPPRRPSAMGFYSREPSGAASSNRSYQRSASRSSMNSSRPWSPVNSSMTSSIASIPPIPNMRPGSRISSVPALPITPRSRPKTPSHIPTPRSHHRTPSSAEPSPTKTDSDVILSTSTSGYFRPETPSGISAPPPRPPSRSMIPMPSVHLTSASRPGTAMSAYRPESSMSVRSPPLASTPSKNRSRQSVDVPTRSTLSVGGKLPPSSFKDASGRSPGGVSRAPSRAGAQTPLEGVGPVHIYGPINQKDPLDVEFGSIVNSLGHSFVIERVDPLRAAPRAGEEVRAQYAFSTPLGRKVINCKLTTMGRTGSEPSHKVLCRVGGGWQDLRTFLLSKQIGL